MSLTERDTRTLHIVSGGTSGATDPTWAIDITGNATFQNVNIKGQLILVGGGTLGTVMDNNEFLSGLTTGGVVKRLIGVNASDLVSIDPDAIGVTMAGSLAVTGAQTFTGATLFGGALTFPAAASFTAATTFTFNTGQVVAGGGISLVTGTLTGTDTSFAIGDATHRASNIFSVVGTFGTTPATVGDIRLPALSAGIRLRNNANSDNVVLADMTAADIIQFGGGTPIAASMYFAAATAGSFVFNNGQLDVDLRIATDTNANHFVSDAGLFTGVGGFGFGGVAGNNGYITINPPTMTAVANADFAKLYIVGGAITTIPAGTTAIAASVTIGEPNLTATGTVSDATTLYIPNAPTEGTRNTAFFIAAGTVRWAGYGAGAATFDASGNITSVSDERLKVKQGNFTDGLDAILKINPVLYKWNEESGMETEHTYAGFFAQNVQAASPWGVGIKDDERKTMSLQDRAILAMLVNSIKTLNAKITTLEQRQ